MTMFKRILVPLDFSSKNAAALETALDLARQNGSRIFLLHVIEPVDYIPAVELKSFYRELERAAKAKMKILAKKHVDGDIPMQQDLIYGHRARKIVEHARDQEIDLIVLSSHKVNPDDPAKSWGTLSHKVAILSQCPVLLVK